MVMRRRNFIAGLVSTTAAWPSVARAQQSDRMRRITVWMGRPNDSEGQRLAAAFRDRLEVLGWNNGRNVQTDYRWVTSDMDRVSLAKDIVEQDPNVIVAETTPAVAALARVSNNTPIVFVNVSDPVGAGFVQSLPHPGGRITGFISNEPAIGGKWPGFLKEIAPATAQVGFMFNPDTATYTEPFLRQAEAAADQLGIKLAASPIHSDVEIDRTIAELGSAQGGGLVVLPDPVTNTHSALIISLAAQYRVPTIYAWQFQARGGGLMSYGTDIADSFRAAASYADRIIRGETVASLPVQTPTKFYLVINRKTAKALNLQRAGDAAGRRRRGDRITFFTAAQNVRLWHLADIGTCLRAGFIMPQRS
jgi:putative tryptophan/tyrosine transport system substrate-binding protein